MDCDVLLGIISGVATIAVAGIYFLLGKRRIAIEGKKSSLDLTAEVFHDVLERLRSVELDNQALHSAKHKMLNEQQALVLRYEDALQRHSVDLEAATRDCDERIARLEAVHELRICELEKKINGT